MLMISFGAMPDYAIVTIPLTGRELVHCCDQGAANAGGGVCTASARTSAGARAMVWVRVRVWVRFRVMVMVRVRVRVRVRFAALALAATALAATLLPPLSVILTHRDGSTWESDLNRA